MRRTTLTNPFESAGEGQQKGEVSASFPPRSKKHPPEFLKLSRFFHISLMVLFVLLIVGILAWYVFYFGKTAEFVFATEFTSGSVMYRFRLFDKSAERKRTSKSRLR